ncbi:MAG TPA: hypothetical protein VHI11_06805 [Jiangellaceae bacterium]|jgi:hypothetical protein|nr:hypothetical protein [Jiangellaceae bacterium]
MSEPELPGPGPAPTGATGDPRVDAALQPLEALDEAPVHEHPTVIEEAHRALQDILAEERE